MNQGWTRSTLLDYLMKLQGRVTKKISQEVSRLDNSQVQVHTGNVSRASRDGLVENHEFSEDQPHTTLIINWTSRRTECFTLFFLNKRTSSHIAWSSRWTLQMQPKSSSGKNKKVLWSTQPQLGSENNQVTIKAEQFLSTLQGIATNHDNANFNHNIKQISKLKSQTTTISTFPRKSE